MKLSGLRQPTNESPLYIANRASSKRGHAIANTWAELERKSCDLIVASHGCGGTMVFGCDYNEVHLVSTNGVTRWPGASKAKVATKLATRLADKFSGQRRFDGQDDTLKIAIRCYPHGVGLTAPACTSAGAAGMGHLAALTRGQRLTLELDARDLVPTDFAIRLPEGFERQIGQRSGLAFERGVDPLNVLLKFSAQPSEIIRDKRIARLLVVRHVHIDLMETQIDLNATNRQRGIWIDADKSGA